MKIIALAICVCAFAASGEDMTRAIGFTKGALAKTCLRIVDQDGFSVQGARIYGGFTLGGRDKYVLVDGVTNTNGEYIAEGKCNDWLHYSITKDGYYMSSGDVKYLDTKSVPAVVDGKWQPYGETRTVVLKKVRNPWAVNVFGGDECHRKIPAFDQWIPFDMEKFDWLSPYGNGYFNDVLLRFMKKETDKWYVYTFSMEACFTNNPYAGFYITTLDEFSDLKTDYFANTNVVYQTNYAFLKECIERQPVKITGLGTDQYLVFRTRTRVDEDGNLIGAHYGKISRGWYSNGKEMHHGGGCFNPVENDLNIEGDQTLLDAIKNYKKK